MCMSIMQIQKFLPHKMLITCQCWSIQNYAVALWLMQAGTNDSSHPTHRVHALLVLSASSFIWKLIFSEVMEDWAERKIISCFLFWWNCNDRYKKGSLVFPFLVKSNIRNLNVNLYILLLAKNDIRNQNSNIKFCWKKQPECHFLFPFQGKQEIRMLITNECEWVAWNGSGASHYCRHGPLN